MRRICRRRRPQAGSIELAETRDADEAERSSDLVLEKFEHAHDARLSGGRKRVALHAAEADEMRPAAIALMMSVPRQKPPSTMMAARPATASTISGNTSIAPRP